MARLAAVEKGEYYPTPPSIIRQISQYLTPDGGRGTIRLLDPCCGEGQALCDLAKSLRSATDRPVETWGVEISPPRAQAAAERLDLIVEAPFEAVGWSPRTYGAASLLFLNPPYDHGHYNRMETTFLEMTTPALVPGGILVAIVPAHALNWQFLSYLTRHYETIDGFRFGDVEGPAGFDTFKQVVVLGQKRAEPLKRYGPQARDARKQVDEAIGGYRVGRSDAYKARVPTQLDRVYLVRPTRSRASLRRERYLPGEIDALAEAQWDQVSEDAAGRLLKSAIATPEPLMGLSVGHVAMVLAAGLIGSIESPGTIFKGRVVKRTVTVPHPEKAETIIERQVHRTHVVRVSPEGLEHLSKPHRVTAFLEEHVEELGDALARRLRPYGDDVQPWEEAVLAALSKDKKLPNAQTVGLLPKQKAYAVALTRSIARHRVAHLIGEMGVGKSRISLAAVELMDAYPALVICPPHMVDKWKAEVEGAIPGAQGEIVESVTDLERVRARQARDSDRKTVVIAARSRIKLGPGWDHTAATRRYLPPAEDRGPFRAALRTYRRWREAYVRRKPTMDEAQRAKAQAAVAQARAEALAQAVSVPVCPDCGQPLPGDDLTSNSPTHCPHRVKGRWDALERTLTEEPCGGPAFAFGERYHRVPLASYIVDHMPGFFRILLADEVHQYKAKDSDQGWAFGLLAAHLPVITLTGTFMGGPASSIFWILHRTQADVRRAYAFSDEARWVRRFGVVETTYKLEDGGGHFGAYNGKRRRKVAVKERPGIAPAIMRYLLPTAVFVSLKDLGLDLPPFHEEIVRFDPPPAMAEDLDRVFRFTWDEMRAHWPHYTSSWLQWNLARPNSCFREEVIEGHSLDEHGEPRVLRRPALVNGHDPGSEKPTLLPKERWLVEKVTSELEAGRRVVVYVRQTGTRDIRERLRTIMCKAGLPGIGILDATTAPRKRMAWLEQHPSNVLITNPRLVETGLDLIAYRTAIFYEVDYSLYTMWQACRRLWRLGQTAPVKVFYLTYTGTLEEKAYALVGEKLKAAKLLHGDNVAGALVPDGGDGSLVMSLIRALKDGQELRLEGAGLFEDEHQELVSTSTTGSLIHRSQELTWVEAFCQDRGVSYETVKPRRRWKRTIRPQPGQMAMAL